MQVNLPQEILEDILLKIPAEFIVTFKVVCKLWFDLISNPTFVKAHLNRHRGDFYQILVNKRKNYLFQEYELIKVQELKDTNKSQLHIDELQELLNDDTLTLHFSCDGFLLFESSNICRQLYICNPVTRICTTLPILKIVQIYITDWTLVYDSSVQKYKVVGSASHQGRCFLFTSHSFENSNEGNSGNTAAAAAAATSNGWRELIMPHTYFKSGPTVVNGEVHFLATRRRKPFKPFMCSVDVAKGGIREMRVPFSFYNSADAIIELMGSLCVIPYSPKSEYDIWTLQDRNEGLWIKNYSVNLQFEPSVGNGRISLFSYPSSTYSCQKKILICHQNQIFVYDLEKKDFKKMDFVIPEDMSVSHNFFHANSLVKWE